MLRGEISIVFRVFVKSQPFDSCYCKTNIPGWSKQSSGQIWGLLRHFATAWCRRGTGLHRTPRKYIASIVPKVFCKTREFYSATFGTLLPPNNTRADTHHCMVQVGRHTTTPNDTASIAPKVFCKTRESFSAAFGTLLPTNDTRADT